MEYSNFIKETLREAGMIALKGYGNVEPMIKSEGNMQILTETDLKIGQMIIDKIKQNFPEHSIIDEEAGITLENSEFVWTIDPVDGTANYASKIPMFGTMIGLLKNGKPIAGGLILPCFNEIYYAEKGHGAFCNDRQIHVSQNPELAHNFVAYLISSHQSTQGMLDKELKYITKIIPNIMSFRTSNCSAFDGAMTVSGRYGAALNTTSYVWDCVPLHILALESGGIMTDFDGNEIDYSHLDNKYKNYFTFCLGSQSIHQQIQELIKNH